jgi:hypothetical protein
MASARGDALDWALALARAPGERFALRQQPLPAGMEAVLQIAGGNHVDAIEAAAARAGMTSAEVVDVARFYLREMLFFPDADPYRVLGLSADASDEQVKHHHRLLQQWLHPDRPTSDWDAAFAARVNAAWSQLRTSVRREAYAATLATAPVVPPAATDSPPSWSPPARIHASSPDAAYADPAFDEGRWRRRAPVLALFGVCAVLGVLAVRDMQREPDTGLTGTQAAAMEAAEEAPAVALQLPAATPQSESDTAAKPAPPKRVTPAPATRAAPIAVAAKPIPKPAAQPVAKPVRRSATPPAAVAVASKPAPKPLPKPMANPIATPVVIAAASNPRPAVAKPVATAAPKVAPTAAKVASATPKVTPALAAAPPKPAAKSAAKPVPASAPVATPPVAAVATPVPKASIKPAPVAQPSSEPKPSVAAAPVAVATAATPAATHSPAQVAQAQQTGQRLLAYVSGRGSGMPPIWANLSAQKQASAAREALQGDGRVAVGSPDWQLGGSSAAMQASLTPGRGGARRLRAEMVWREQRWWVAGLSLEQAP